MRYWHLSWPSFMSQLASFLKFYFITFWASLLIRTNIDQLDAYPKEPNDPLCPACSVLPMSFFAYIRRPQAPQSLLKYQTISDNHLVNNHLTTTAPLYISWTYHLIKCAVCTSCHQIVIWKFVNSLTLPYICSYPNILQSLYLLVNYSQFLIIARTLARLLKSIDFPKSEPTNYKGYNPFVTH